MTPKSAEERIEKIIVDWLKSGNENATHVAHLISQFYASQYPFPSTPEKKEKYWQAMSDQACDELDINNEYIGRVFQWILKNSEQSEKCRICDNLIVFDVDHEPNCPHNPNYRKPEDEPYYIDDKINSLPPLKEEPRKKEDGKLRLFDRADGVKGHYCVGYVVGGYAEYWYSKEYPTKEEANKVLRGLRRMFEPDSEPTENKKDKITPIDIKIHVEENFQGLAEFIKDPEIEEFYSELIVDTVLHFIGERLKGLKGKEEQSWISVEEEIPKGEVLAISNRGDYLVGYVRNDHGRFTCEADDSLIDMVTYWKYLSPPPNQH